MKPLLTLAFLLFLASCSDQKTATAPAPPPPAAEVLTITNATASTEQDYPAALEGKADVEVRPQVDGFLETVFVDEGAHVSAGQPLFRINERPFREAVNSAAASLQAANAAISSAQLEIDKLTPLVQNKVVSEHQLKSANAAYRMAVANAAQARANLASAQIRLGYTLIKAPVSGYVGRLPKKRGSLVSPADPEPLTEVSDVHEVHAYFSVGESDFIRFKSQYAGATIDNKLKALPPVSLVLADNSLYPQTGRIDMVDGRFDKTTGAITLRASFPNEKGLLRSGNTGKVRLAQQQSSAILVPQSSTIDIQDKVFVYLVGDSNKVMKQPVAVAGKSGANYIVKDGVKPGDRIVFSGLDHLAEGMVIKPEPVKAEAVASTNSGRKQRF